MSVDRQSRTGSARKKLEFAYELASRMAQAVNSDRRPEVAAMLGEIWAYSSLTRAAVKAAEAGAHSWGNGAFFCDDNPFNAIRAVMPIWMKSRSAESRLQPIRVASDR
jgi:anthranilate 3-monooxygenase (FAD) / 4-hydroxyphenylacetate 3-monooxygenase